MCNDSILNTVKSVVGTDVLVANSALHTRQEGQNASPWHQVASNWTDEDKKHPSVLVQIALAKSDPKSPVMKFVPGSHSQTLGSEPLEPLNDSFARSKIVDTTPFEKQGVDMSLESGECVFLHPNIVQSSPDQVDDLTLLSVLYVVFERGVRARSTFSCFYHATQITRISHVSLTHTVQENHSKINARMHT